MAPVHS